MFILYMSQQRQLTTLFYVGKGAKQAQISKYCILARYIKKNIFHLDAFIFFELILTSALGIFPGVFPY